MTRTIDLPQKSEARVHELATELHLTEEELLRALVEICITGQDPFSFEKVGSNETKGAAFLALLALIAKSVDGYKIGPIRSTSTILGGDTRIRNTRIAVWLVVAHKKWGESDSEILAQYPGLNAADLTAAWDYYAANSIRIDAERQAHEDAS